MKQLAHRPNLLWGGAIVAFLALLALVAPHLAALDAYTRSGSLVAPPSRLHWLGTDEQGYDTLARVLAGSRLAFIVGPGVACLSVGLGTVLGAIAGYWGGYWDRGITLVADALMALPGILFALLILFVSDSPGIGTVIVALSITGWAGHARLVRVLVASARERDFAIAASLLGASRLRVLLLYVMPEIVGPLTVQLTFAVAAGVLGEASLSFLGLGPQNAVSWGAMLEQGAVLFLRSPAIVLSAGGALFALLLGLNLLGDGLRDLLDPRLGPVQPHKLTRNERLGNAA